MKTVPRPTKGRIVLFCDEENSPTWPAVVLEVDPEDPRRVRLAVFDFDVYVKGSDFPAPTKDFVPYGKGPGCWWYPPHSDATMEVDDS